MPTTAIAQITTRTDEAVEAGQRPAEIQPRITHDRVQHEGERPRLQQLHRGPGEHHQGAQDEQLALSDDVRPEPPDGTPQSGPAPWPASQASPSGRPDHRLADECRATARRPRASCVGSTAASRVRRAHPLPPGDVGANLGQRPSQRRHIARWHQPPELPVVQGCRQLTDGARHHRQPCSEVLIHLERGEVGGPLTAVGCAGDVHALQVGRHRARRQRSGELDLA